MCVRERGGGRRRTTANDGGRRPAGCKRENKNPTVMWGIKRSLARNICISPRFRPNVRHLATDQLAKPHSGRAVDGLSSTHVFRVFEAEMTQKASKSTTRICKNYPPATKNSPRDPKIPWLQYPRTLAATVVPVRPAGCHRVESNCFGRSVASQKAKTAG